MYTDLQSVWEIQACHYSVLGTLTFTTWDIIITMEDEVNGPFDCVHLELNIDVFTEIDQIWSKPWRTLHLLYLFLRYFSWVSQVVAVRVVLGLSAGIPLSVLTCRAFRGFITLSGLSFVFGVEIVEILRVKALYRDNIVIRWCLVALYATEVIVMVVMSSILLLQKAFSDGQCSVLDSHLTLLKLIVPPLVFESVVFVFAMIKFHESIQDGSCLMPVLFKFMTDSIWAFALPLIALTANAVLSTLSGPISLAASVWMLALPGFCGYRLILNLSRLLDPRMTTRTNTVFDTVVDGIMSDPDALPDFSPTDVYGYGTGSWTASDDHGPYV